MRTEDDYSRLVDDLTKQLSGEGPDERIRQIAGDEADKRIFRPMRVKVVRWIGAPAGFGIWAYEAVVTLLDSNRGQSRIGNAFGVDNLRDNLAHAEYERLFFEPRAFVVKNPARSSKQVGIDG